MNAHDESAALGRRLRACRSVLLTPASRPNGLTAARAAGGDAIMVDLEATVVRSDKARAREAALAFLASPPEPDFLRLLRMNSLRTVDGLHDLLALQQSGGRPDAIVIPECECADEIRVVLDVLDGPESVIGVIPMVEFARGVVAADRLAKADERVCGLFLGGGDQAADLGAQGAWEDLLYARARVVAAAAATGIAAIDVPYLGSGELGLRREAMTSRELGMTGKAALHAEQLPIINRVFTPRADTVRRARSVLSPPAHGRAAMLRAAEGTG